MSTKAENPSNLGANDATEEFVAVAVADWSFFYKVLRNAIILGGLYFLSIWATAEAVNWLLLKALIVFFVGYILTELANRYGLKLPTAAKTLML